ncbi:hypothetical protein QTG54_001110 [Skeletonema marinoi]|uniref:Uncharacterized protein n=2 Tax=Skeletonema marinoi TaxID=267567 RepID=A0AAD9DIJ8_9STRA|nr:hypothetical protein QTG54_001110 [Skeletonema marinoi]
MPAACRPAPDATSPGNEKRRKIEQSPYPPPHAYPYAPPMTGSPKQGGAPHAPPGSPYYPHPDPYSYMPPPGHHYGPPPPHPQAGGFPPRPHLPPRFNHHQQYDSSYMAGPPQKQPASPGEAHNGAYPSPNTVTTMDSRSPEGSRNDLGNFEERVSNNNGNPPPPPSYSPASAPNMPPPYMPPPMGYHPSYPPPHYAHHAHHQYHSPHAPTGWACDYCNSKFNNWEECSAHEETCAAKSYYDGRNSHKNAKGRKMKLASFPTDFYMDHNAEYAVNDDRETYLLTTQNDKDSLSDRQCFVRSHFVEVFVADKSDMAARHSRGAQKLNENQIGLRCAYCVKLKPRDRSERAICYPSSISRIYQTVADMQRFHFESCVAIPPKVVAEYKSLKTTRPRGVGSPQGYWDKSAREIGLVDSPNGIKIGEEEGMETMVKQRKGATGLLETMESAPPAMESAPPVSEFPTQQPMNGYALPPAELPPVLASPGNDQDQGEQVTQASPGAPAAPDSLPVVSSPGTPGTEEAPSTPVITQAQEVKAPVPETREADANMLLMLKQTPESPTEDTEGGEGGESADLAVTNTVPV